MNAAKSQETQSKSQEAFLVAVIALLIVIYAALHYFFPPSDVGSFFWKDSPARWLDWLFWCLTGMLLVLSSRCARRYSDPGRGVRLSFRSLLEIARGLVISLLLLYAAVELVDMDVLGLNIRLKEAPTVAVALAFVLGFYSQITEKLLFELGFQLLKRFSERLLGRGIGDTTDDDTYIKLHIDPALQAAYQRAAATQNGRPGHEASRHKRARFKVSNFVSQAGFTVNALKTVYIAQDLLASSSEAAIAEILAHEASHIMQGHLSDSVHQEIEAYVTGARVTEELKEPGEALSKDTAEWIMLSNQISPSQPDEEIKSMAKVDAVKKVRGLKSRAPLYGIIPTDQEEGLRDLMEMLRQAAFLILELLGVSHWFFREK
jgi:hypothetical protein